MLKYYVKATETLKNMRGDRDGVVSFAVRDRRGLYRRRRGCGVRY